MTILYKRSLREHLPVRQRHLDAYFSSPKAPAVPGKHGGGVPAHSERVADGFQAFDGVMKPLEMAAMQLKHPFRANRHPN